MSMLINTKTVEKLRITESEMLGDINNIRLKTLKSDLSEDNKKILVETLATMDEIIKDLFASQYFRTKSIVGSV